MRTALLAGASAAALSLAPVAAVALSPEDAWQSWQDAAADAGVALTVGARAMSGGTLTLSGVAFAAEDDEGMTVTGSMDEVVFAGRGDGTVEVSLPDSYPVTLSGTDSSGAPSSAALVVTHPGLSITMSDAAEGGVATEYAAPEIAVVVGDVTEDGAEADLAGAVTLTGVAGRRARSGADIPEIESAFSAAGVAASFAGTDVESGGTFDLEVAAEDVTSRSSGTLTSFFSATEDLGTLIDEGFTVRGEGSSGPIAFSLATEGMPESFSAEGAIASTSGFARVDGERLEYDVAYNAVALTASGSEIPFPQVTGGIGELRTRFAVPSTPTEEAQPMALTVALRDLTIGEEIWSMFDPAGALPRDPATLVIDLAGRLRLLADVFSEGAMERAEAPAEVEALDIEELRLSLAGAELTGVGAFTFDYDAPGPFGPPPAPDGAVSFRLEGAQGLLESLVRMGLLPEEQAMMARMMTGMIARPAPEGGDALVSEITVQPDGTILANGAPLPF